MGASLELASTPIDASTQHHPRLVTWSGLKHGVSNLVLALAFFSAALPAAERYHSGIANLIWIGGAVIMGGLSLVRLPPRAVRIDLRAICATVGMLVFPAMMRPNAASAGLLAAVAVALELVGVILSQAARIYMGRSFGLFPANRGVVTAGPFRYVRHPIYLGWFILTLGYGCGYPALTNWWLLIGALPFLLWRIRLEEGLLAEDAEYRAYRQQVPFQLIPGLI